MSKFNYGNFSFGIFVVNANKFNLEEATEIYKQMHFNGKPQNSIKTFCRASFGRDMDRNVRPCYTLADEKGHGCFPVWVLIPNTQ